MRWIAQLPPTQPPPRRPLLTVRDLTREREHLFAFVRSQGR